MLDPSSPWGYEMKHAALHSVGRYEDAMAAFETMLQKISQSPDPQLRGECINIIPCLYIELVSQSVIANM